MVADFQQAGPVTASERLCLSAIYAPYITVPLMLVYHMLMSVDYAPPATDTRQSSLKQH